MKHLCSAVAVALLALMLVGSPAAAADFPEQAHPPACEVVIALPIDIIGHLSATAPHAAGRLARLLADACG